ncbi:unnamed protein product [Rotaria sordida]|uniref:Uncharacterized protein n=1 Tax=Rotaria sordida TaxID=392033 RepID=A0A816DBS8_9BILA|nr:unnamed protein product [Rotaria sordida]CAF1635222.1 unnamed protein product [Rotaria sordida]
MNLRFCAYLNIRKHKIELSKQYLAVFDDTTNSEFLAAHRNYIEKFQAIELSQELTTTRTHLTRFLFFECLELYMFSWNIKHLSSLIQTSLENSDIDSGWRSTSCQNLLDLALKRLFESFPFYFLIN